MTRSASEMPVVTPARAPLIAISTTIPPITTLTPTPPTDKSDAPYPSSPTSTHGITPVGMTPDEPAVLTHCASFARAWVPTYTPSWSLGPQHGNYLRAAVPYLVTVPGGPQWKKLLASYMVFESLLSSRSVSGSLHR